MAKFKNYFWPGRFATERTGNRGQDTGDRIQGTGSDVSDLDPRLSALDSARWPRIGLDDGFRGPMFTAGRDARTVRTRFALQGHSGRADRRGAVTAGDLKRRLT